VCTAFAAIAKMLIFLVDHPNETKKNPNSVIRVTRITDYSVIQLFGSLGHPNNRIQFYGSPELTRMHPNAPEFNDNHPKPFGSLAKKWNLS
jgi:hypothetical protein